MYQSVSGEILWAFTVLHWHQLLLHLTLHFNLNVHACKLHKMYYVGRIWCVYLWLSYCNCGLEFCAVKTALLKPEETFRIKQLICQGFTWLSNCCKSHCRRQRFILETHPNLKPELRFLPPLIVPNWRHTCSFVTDKGSRHGCSSVTPPTIVPTQGRFLVNITPTLHYMFTYGHQPPLALSCFLWRLFSALYLATRPPVRILFSLTRP